MSLAVGSLFTGYGGLDMAVAEVLGGRTVWTCDIDPGASRIIAHRYPDAPNLGDITKVDWATVEPIDALTGGWPCQPFSHAGKRLGAADERALWPEVVRALRILRPRYVVLENVAAIVTAGELARAVTDLATLGYVGQWRPAGAARDHATAGHGAARGAYAPAIGRWERVTGRLAPAPTETSAKGAPRLAPAFVEWMMGLPAGWVTDVPGLTWNAMLKALGNGVVPQQAEAAIREAVG